MSKRMSYYVKLLRIADNLRRGLITEEEYCEQVMLTVADSAEEGLAMSDRVEDLPMIVQLEAEVAALRAWVASLEEALAIARIDIVTLGQLAGAISADRVATDAMGRVDAALSGPPSCLDGEGGVCGECEWCALAVPSVNAAADCNCDVTM